MLPQSVVNSSIRSIIKEWMDLVLAFPVALLVFYSGWSVLKENLPWLVEQK